MFHDLMSRHEAVEQPKSFQHKPIHAALMSTNEVCFDNPMTPIPFTPALCLVPKKSAAPSVCCSSQLYGE